MVDTQVIPDGVLGEYGLEKARISGLGNGLINQTHLVETDGGERFVLQRVNPMFPPAINDDIDRVTRRLAEKGMPTMRIVPNQRGAMCVKTEQSVWRLLTYIEGVSHDALSGPEQAREAGSLLGRFHGAVGDMDNDFANLRPGIHDTVAHLRFLKETLAIKTDHPRYSTVAKLGREILAISDALPELPALPDRVAHGDPKINNILFDKDTGKALCLVDLDTITRMPLPLELGDALRSWCNASGEDDRIGAFSADLFEPSVQGYASVAPDWVTPAEWAAIVPATEIILVELASRFCADALNESYFGWDPDRFASRSEHNLVRASSQLTVARSLAAQRKTLEKIVANSI